MTSADTLRQGTDSPLLSDENEIAIFDRTDGTAALKGCPSVRKAEVFGCSRRGHAHFRVKSRMAARRPRLKLDSTLEDPERAPSAMSSSALQTLSSH